MRFWTIQSSSRFHFLTTNLPRNSNPALALGRHRTRKFHDEDEDVRGGSKFPPLHICPPPRSSPLLFSPLLSFDFSCLFPLTHLSSCSAQYVGFLSNFHLLFSSFSLFVFCCRKGTAAAETAETAIDKADDYIEFKRHSVRILNWREWLI